MKVTDILNLEQRLIKTSAPSTTSPSGTSFQQLLESKVHTHLTRTDAVHKQQSVPSANLDPTIRIESLHITEQIIQLLEEYEVALQNQSFHVNELEPFVSSLEEKTAALIDLKNQIDPHDPLAKLLDQVSSVSYLESVKYRRGSYNV